MSSPLKGRCRLCRREAELQESHIIPKFAIRWMKETGTGYFRAVKAPNVRLQDGVKERLLCWDCEQAFSERENYFASHVFKPMLSGAAFVNYDERLAYFVVSLVWRAVHRHLVEARVERYCFLQNIEEAETEWREFLLGQGSLNRFDHLHIFVADIAVANPPGVPNFNVYCARASDATFFDIEDRCYVVAKFARFFFVAPITPYAEGDWIGTCILNGSGTLRIPQTIKDTAFGGWIMARAKFASEKLDAGLSNRQIRAIQEHVRNLPKIKQSDLYKVALADHLDTERIRFNARATGRNDPCPCGSGLKFKKCHGR
jgi:hypothetical protein